jgi:hypothetical protein
MSLFLSFGFEQKLVFVKHRGGHLIPRVRGVKRHSAALTVIFLPGRRAHVGLTLETIPAAKN